MELIVAIGIIIVGLLLMAAEVYLVPGFNVVGIIGFLLIVFALGFTFSHAGFLGGVTTMVSTVVAGGGLFYWMWQSGAWDRFVLETSLSKDDNLIARESEQRTHYLGKTGLALTPLRPSGVVEIDQERIEVVTEGDFIAAGSKVRVVAMDRRRYFVRLSETQPEQATS